MSDNEMLTVSVKVRNTGKITGKEVVQLYVRDSQSSIVRPQKELKGFEKIELQPGEEKVVTFTLDKRSFAYYNTNIKDWCVESGLFEILIGKSSRNIVLSEFVTVQSTTENRKQYTRNTTIGEIISAPDKICIVEKEIRQMNKVFGGGEDLQQAGAFFRNLPLRALVAFSSSSFKEEKLKEVLNKLNS